jgi:hypothetical protein
VDRAFGTQSCGHGPEAAFGPPQTPYLPGDPRHDGNPYGGNPFGGEPPRPDKRGFWAGCAAALGLCCTCKVCCADEFEGPWSRQRREGCCSSCDCSCCDACECCECCECLSCCDC